MVFGASRGKYGVLLRILDRFLLVCGWLLLVIVGGILVSWKLGNVAISTF